MEPTISEIQSTADLLASAINRGALKREKDPLGSGEVYTIEPEPGHKIIVGTIAKGKSRRMDGDMLFMPHPKLRRRLADAWALIRSGLSIAIGKPSILRVKK